MLLGISDQFAFRFLITANIALTVAGSSIIGFSIYQKVTAPVKVSDEIDDSNEYSGTTTIVSGCFLLIVGPAGLFGVLLKHRIILIVYASLLGVSLVSHLAFTVVLGVASISMTKKVTDNMHEAIMKQYGNNSDLNTKEFEVDINDYQNSKLCCGWSGKLEENIFLKTPWYKKINANATQVRTLPDSCCLKPGDKCRATQNQKEARDNGFVYPSDCLAIIVTNLRIFISVALIILVLLTVFQIAMVTFIVLFLLQGGGPPAAE